MATTLRPGRKKVTTSFTMYPETHKEFHAKHPQRGEKSYIIEQLVKKFLSGEIFIPPKPSF